MKRTGPIWCFCGWTYKSLITLLFIKTEWNNIVWQQEVNCMYWTLHACMILNFKHIGWKRFHLSFIIILLKTPKKYTTKNILFGQHSGMQTNKHLTFVLVILASVCIKEACGDCLPFEKICSSLWFLYWRWANRFLLGNHP